MKSKIIAAALVAGMASPAAASVLDFTADNATGGAVLGTTWTAIPSGGSLVNTTHGNNNGCTGAGWDFVCAGTGPYDVGFGIPGGGNNTEIDEGSEYVQIDFGKTLTVTGFAGMLTYDDVTPVPEGDREQVVLQYLLDDNVTWMEAGIAEPLFPINTGGGSFDTVGLAYLRGLNVRTTSVRFLARGIGDGDDGNANVTAAGLELAPVPVPAAFPLLLAGMGALGWAARRKKRAAA